MLHIEAALNVFLMTMNQIDRDFHLLIADDDEEDVEIFIMALKSTAFNGSYTIANDGIDALNKLKELPFVPHLVILDLNMPRMHGGECMQQIRQMDRFAAVPIVIYSTSSFPGEREKLLQAGAAAFLTKEFSFQKIAEQINALLDAYMPTEQVTHKQADL